MSTEARCRATKAAGEPCGASPQLIGEDGFCPAHRPGARERLSEAGRKGAEALRDKYRKPNVQADAWALESPSDAQEWLQRIASAVLGGEITHHQANAASKALKTWLDAEGARLDVADVEELQEIAKQLKGKGGRKLRVAR